MKYFLCIFYTNIISEAILLVLNGGKAHDWEQITSLSVDTIGMNLQ